MKSETDKRKPLNEAHRKGKIIKTKKEEALNWGRRNQDKVQEIKSGRL